MAPITGFQANTTIHAAFWIYKPDPTVDPVSKEEFIEVNAIQRISANAQTVLTTISSIQVVGSLLTVTCATTGGLRSTQLVIFYGLTNATFLNGQVVYIKSVTPTTFTAIFAAPLAWNSVTEYVPGNAVNYLGVTYYCILTNTNEVPPNATYWSLNYGPAAEPFGAQLIDTTNRTAYLTYAESAVSPSQSPTKLEGAIAARFLYDMEALFY